MRFAHPQTDLAIKGAKRAPPTMRACSLFLAATALFPAPAAATVYEIADDGTVQVCDNGKLEPQSSTADVALPEAAPAVPPAAITTIVQPDVPPGFRQPLLSASSRYDLSPRLLAALAGQESAWRQAVVSPKGAVGLTQLMPATARALAVDPRDPSANLDGGARYLRMLLDQFGGNVELALAAYNAGPARVAKARGVPAIPETRAYVAGIVDRLGKTAAAEGER